MADAVWIQERITKLRTAIVAYEDALIAMASGAQSYSLDTGQSRQTVTKADVSSLNRVLESFKRSLTEYEAELVVAQGGSSGRGVYVRPGF